MWTVYYFSEAARDGQDEFQVEHMDTALSPHLPIPLLKTLVWSVRTDDLISEAEGLAFYR